MQFLNHLMVGQYIPTGSPVHRLDPRAKIGALFFSLVGIFAVRDLLVASIWALIFLALLRLSRLPFWVVTRGIRSVLLLVVITASVHLFFAEGRALLEIGPLRITDQGVWFALLFSLRLTLLILYSSLLTLTTSPFEIADGLERMLKPLSRVGFPSHEVSMMLTIALRFIPTLMDEADRIVKAQVSRGARIETGGLMGRVRAFVPVLVPLFFSVFKRAEELAVAMESRCYRGGEGRTRMKEMRWSLRDSLFLLASLSVAVALGLWGRKGPLAL